MRCCLIFIALNAELRKWAGEQHYVVKIEIVFVLLLISAVPPVYVVKHQDYSCWGDPSCTPHRESFRKQGMMMPYRNAQDSSMFSPSVWRYSYLRILSLSGGPSLSLLFLPTLEKLTGGHLLFLPSPIPPPSLPPHSVNKTSFFFFFFWKLSFLSMDCIDFSTTPTSHSRMLRGMWPILAKQISPLLYTYNALGVGTTLKKSRVPF